MKRLIFLGFLFLGVIADAAIYKQTWKQEYDTATGQSTFTCVAFFYVGIDTTNVYVALLGTGTVRAKEAVFDKIVCNSLTGVTDDQVRLSTYTITQMLTTGNVGDIWKLFPSSPSWGADTGGGSGIDQLCRESTGYLLMSKFDKSGGDITGSVNFTTASIVNIYGADGVSYMQLWVNGAGDSKINSVGGDISFYSQTNESTFNNQDVVGIYDLTLNNSLSAPLVYATNIQGATTYLRLLIDNIILSTGSQEQRLIQLAIDTTTIYNMEIETRKSTNTITRLNTEGSVGQVWQVFPSSPSYGFNTAPGDNLGNHTATQDIIARQFTIKIGTIAQDNGDAIYISTGIIFISPTGTEISKILDFSYLPNSGLSASSNYPIYISNANKWSDKGNLTATGLATSFWSGTTGNTMQLQADNADIQIKVFGTGNVILPTTSSSLSKFGDWYTGIMQGTFTVYGLFVSTGQFENLYLNGIKVATINDLSSAIDYACRLSTGAMLLEINNHTARLNQLQIDTTTLQGRDNAQDSRLNQLQIDSTTLQAQATSNTSRLNQLQIDSTTLASISSQLKIDTGTLAGIITQLKIDSGTLVGVDNQIKVSTGAILAIQNQVRIDTGTLAGIIAQLKIDSGTIVGIMATKLPDSLSVIRSSHIADGTISPIDCAVWHTTGAINIVFGSTDAVTATDLINQQVDIFSGSDIILKRWYIEECTDTSGSCAIQISTESFGGVHGIIDGGAGADNTKRPNLTSQADSSGTTAGWTTTSMGSGGCLRAKIISATSTKKLTLALIFWKANK